MAEKWGGWEMMVVVVVELTQCCRYSFDAGLDKAVVSKQSLKDAVRCCLCCRCR